MQWKFIIMWRLDKGESDYGALGENYIAEDAAHVIAQWEGMRNSCNESIDNSQIISIKKLESHNG